MPWYKTVNVIALVSVNEVTLRRARRLVPESVASKDR